MKINCQNSILYSKPLKKFPEVLVYNQGNHYNMSETKYGQYVGEMDTAVVLHNKSDKTYYRLGKKYKALHIVNLNIEEKGLGYGRTFLNIAKAESKRLGCGGRLTLTASRVFDYRNPPHVFYKKYGFISNSEKMNKLLDSCIRYNQVLSWENADNLEMYLPVGDIKKKFSLFEGLFKLLYKFKRI